MTDTAELKRLREAGTPGPWSASREQSGGQDLWGKDASGFTCLIGHIEADRWPYLETVDQANAALIVAAVNALPGLLERVEELEAAISNVMRTHRPYADESGVVEVPLSAFARLVRVSKEETQRQIDDVAKLNQPDGVLVNMLRGTIPKVPASSLYKLYTEDELLEAARCAAPKGEA